MVVIEVRAILLCHTCFTLIEDTTIGLLPKEPWAMEESLQLEAS